jgi:hypothetical protein
MCMYVCIYVYMHVCVCVCAENELLTSIYSGLSALSMMALFVAHLYPIDLGWMLVVCVFLLAVGNLIIAPLAK